MPRQVPHNLYTVRGPLLKSKTGRRVVAELRRLISLEDSSFGDPTGSSKHPLPKTEAEVDAFIRARTRLYREAWIFPLLDVLDGEEEKGG